MALRAVDDVITVGNTHILHYNVIDGILSAVIAFIFNTTWNFIWKDNQNVALRAIDDIMTVGIPTFFLSIVITSLLQVEIALCFELYAF